jgi:hypothetical protein
MHAARDSTDRPRRRRCHPVASPATAPLPGLELHRGRVLQPVEQVRAAVAVRTVAGELRRPVRRRARRGPPARGVAADEVRAGADAPHVVLADVEVCHGVQAPELDRRDVVSLCRFLLRACTTWTDTVLPLTLLMTSKSCICITAEFRSVLTVSASSTSDTHTQKKLTERAKIQVLVPRHSPNPGLPPPVLVVPARMHGEERLHTRGSSTRVRVRVREIRDSAELIRSFGVLEKAAGGREQAPCHASVHGCSPREAAAVPATNFAAENSSAALVSAPDVFIRALRLRLWMHL